MVYSDTRVKKKNVKLTRKSPYVVGPYASTAILKGTPKPSINVRKPLGKPPVPAKPEKLLSGSSGGSCSTSSSGSVSPIAAPRRPENSIVKSGVQLQNSR